MIAHGSIALSLSGRVREPRPTRLLEGLAHLLITGFFYQHDEREAIPAGAMATTLLERLEQTLSVRPILGQVDGKPLAGGDAGAGRWTPREAHQLELSLAGGEAKCPFRLKLRARERHPWGTPGLVLALEVLELPKVVATEGESDIASRARAAAATLLRSSSARDAANVSLMMRARSLLDALVGHCRAVLPCEQVVTDLELAFPSAVSPDALLGYPSDAALWISALSAEALAHPDLVHDFSPWAMDGGGDLSAGAPGPDGGGVFDHTGSAASGGGSL